MADAQTLLATAGAMARFWYTQGHLREGHARLERALATDPAPTPARALALIGLVLLGPDDARAEEARRVAEASGDPRLQAIATGLSGSAILYADSVGAQALLQSAIGVLDELDIHWSLTFRRSYAAALGALADAEAQREAHLENLRIAREVGNRRVEAVTLGALAMNAVDSPRQAEALPLLEAAIALHRELGDPLESSYDVDRLAAIAAFEGFIPEAVALFAAGHALRVELGLEWTWAFEFRKEMLTAVGVTFDAEEHAAAREQGVVMSLDEALDFGLALLRG